MSSDATQVTRRWLEQVVIGLDLCPFAARELAAERVRFAECDAVEVDALLLFLATEVLSLAEDPATETTLLIFPLALSDFDDYLDFLALAQVWLEDSGLDGTFQFASFHPDYCFEGCAPDDASNYTNRSPFPVIHILREASVEKAIASHPDPDMIPRRNIALANEKGSTFWQQLLDNLG